jgi:hypothetical protein
MRGVSAFCPSDQTRGAVANSVLTAPTPSSSTVVATSRGMRPPTQAATLPVNMNNVPVHDRPESSDDDSIPPSTPVRPSSMIFSAISKRKHSALDDDASASSYSGKRTRKSASSGASALHSIKDMMAGISTSMHNGPLGQPRHHRRSSAEHRIEATALLQEKEDLTVNQIVAFADLFEQNTLKADTYMALIRDDVRKLWVQKQLKELGFPMVGSGSEA